MCNPKGASKKDPSDFSHQLSERERNAQCKGERGICMKEEKLKAFFFFLLNSIPKQTKID